MKEILEEILKDPRSSIALFALIISVISLILAVYTAIQNRKNNRLGVRPLAYVLPMDYEDHIAVIIQNKGTGPLISSKISFHNGKQERDYLVDFMPALNEGFYWTTFSKTKRIVLRPGEDKALLEFKGDIQNQDYIKQRDIIRKELSKIEIKLNYTSVFNERNPFKLNFKLSWYSRLK